MMTREYRGEKTDKERLLRIIVGIACRVLRQPVSSGFLAYNADSKSSQTR